MSGKYGGGGVALTRQILAVGERIQINGGLVKHAHLSSHNKTRLQAALPLALEEPQWWSPADAAAASLCSYTAARAHPAPFTSCSHALP